MKYENEQRQKQQQLRRKQQQQQQKSGNRRNDAPPVVQPSESSRIVLGRAARILEKNESNHAIVAVSASNKRSNKHGTMIQVSHGKRTREENAASNKHSFPIVNHHPETLATPSNGQSQIKMTTTTTTIPIQQRHEMMTMVFWTMMRKMAAKIPLIVNTVPRPRMGTTTPGKTMETTPVTVSKEVGVVDEFAVEFDADDGDDDDEDDDDHVVVEEDDPNGYADSFIVEAADGSAYNSCDRIMPKHRMAYDSRTHLLQTQHDFGGPSSCCSSA
jgi:hypothetical protein